jgi:hypothetical protein
MEHGSSPRFNKNYVCKGSVSILQGLSHEIDLAFDDVYS